MDFVVTARLKTDWVVRVEYQVQGKDALEALTKITPVIKKTYEIIEVSVVKYG